MKNTFKTFVALASVTTALVAVSALDAKASSPTVSMASSAAAGYSQNVASIQTILQNMGYIGFAPNGVMDQTTRSAISRFQLDNGLPNSGRVDVRTAQVLNDRYNQGWQATQRQSQGGVNLSPNEPYVKSPGLLSPNNIAWGVAGAAVVGGAFALTSSGGGSSSGGGGAAGPAAGSLTVDFGVVSNDVGNSAYDGASLQAGFDNPAADDAATFITAETGGNEGIEQLNANDAHARGYDGRVYNRDAAGVLLNDDFDSYVAVAVIDSGVDTDHPDLVNNLLLDHDVTCVASGCSGDAEADTDGHGTNVAGVIAAERNAVGTSGIAPEAKILPIKSDLTNSSLVRSYEYINAFTNVDIVNNSYGADLSISPG